jgi:hypothetical protein
MIPRIEPRAAVADGPNVIRDLGLDTEAAADAGAVLGIELAVLALTAPGELGEPGLRVGGPLSVISPGPG